MLLRLFVTICIILVSFDVFAQQTRDQIRAVGSSTVFPFTASVSEVFSRTGRKSPIVESVGTGGGFRLFCNGIGVQHPDISNASRAISASEIQNCARNGVTEITEVPIGFDGIVLAIRKNNTSFNVTRQQIWLALARNVPVNGQLVSNPYQKWSEIDSSLPDSLIEVMGPPPTSGTRDSFVELVMDVGCKDFAEIKAISDSRLKQQSCSAIREDGRFVEAGENDNLIVQRITSSRNLIIGIFGYSFLQENPDKLNGLGIDGVDPTVENITSQKYPIARSMFIYIKNAHLNVIPGLREFVAEYVSERAMGNRGYLVRKGLIPLKAEEREVVRKNVSSFIPLKR